MDGAKVS